MKKLLVIGLITSSFVFGGCFKGEKVIVPEVQKQVQENVQTGIIQTGSVETIKPVEVNSGVIEQVQTGSISGSGTGILTRVTKQDLSTVFDLSKKEQDTKIYYSDKLGVGFTYAPNPDNFSIKVTEIGNKIYISGTNEDPEKLGKSIEIFTKDPKISLEEAIKTKFLHGYNSNDCFVKAGSITNPSNYTSAEIGYRPTLTNDPNAPWWSGSEKCPEIYTRLNDIRFFFMDKNVPEKFLFIILGQDVITSNGIPGTDWSSSIKILK